MRVLVDTNVYIYRLDKNERAKQPRADRILAALLQGGHGATSVQVAEELANVLLGRRRGLMREGKAREVVGETLRDWPVTLLGPQTVALALEGVSRFGFSYYDAQIWAAAKLAGALVVLSEDFADGLDADGVRFVNPFAPDFDVDAFLGGL